MVLPQSMKAMKCTMKRVKVKHTLKRTRKSAWEMAVRCNKLHLAWLVQRVNMLEEAVSELHAAIDRIDRTIDRLDR